MSTINRVATASMYDNSIRNIGARQNSLVDQNEKLTAGKRVLRASDDPVAAAQAERAITRIERIKVEQQALNIQRNAVAEAESSMGDAINLIQNIRELMVHAGDGSHSPQDRRIIAGQIEAMRDELINVSNRKDTNGQPLLGALGSALAPFIGNTPDNFLGLAGQSGGSSVGIPTMLDGDSAFMFQTKRDGAYTAGLSNAETPPVSFLGRKFGTSEIKVLDATKIPSNADGTPMEFEIVFTAVEPMPGPPPSNIDPYKSTATYEIRDKATGDVLYPEAGDPDLTISDFANNKPLSIEVTSIPGLKFSIDTSPITDAEGKVKPGVFTNDTITLKPSTSIFDSIDQAINGIANAADSNAAAQAVGQGLSNLDRGMERIQAIRGFAGEMLNRADRITGNQDARNIQLEGDRSRAEDLDMVQGFSDFQQTQMGYQAALQSYAMVQKLSLFNYIS